MSSPELAGSATAGLDPRLATMLGMLQGGGAGDAGATLQAQLAGLADANPQLAMILQMLQQRAAPASNEGAEIIDEAVDSAKPAIDPADVLELMQGAEALQAELDALRVRNDTLAAALGACHLCFGQDDGCPGCCGLGKPGWRRPESHAFRRFVVPALQRARAAAASASPKGAPPRAATELPGSAEGLRARAA
jgi:hypothetical protein